MSHLHIVRHQSRRDLRTNAIAIRKTTSTGKGIHVSLSQNPSNHYASTLGMLTMSQRYDEMVRKERLEVSRGLGRSKRLDFSVDYLSLKNLHIHARRHDWLTGHLKDCKGSIWHSFGAGEVLLDVLYQNARCYKQQNYNYSLFISSPLLDLT